jgi:hypothetical protein
MEKQHFNRQRENDWALKHNNINKIQRGIYYWTSITKLL